MTILPLIRLSTSECCMGIMVTAGIVTYAVSGVPSNSKGNRGYT